ncbi:DNA-processing protein DprA [Homoserinibacter sp. YIM 151385]|uniref:DNA-processing protein DprA n=1 Tax=Homoserinibacter sp. YIM 151385 TaxID=2985506 RepID=UPI0022F0C20D|nr:DNA-processing protein DprA [Homoserinibacter sp. YIM 151385]WBU39168.1 DNA-processing protein DprA [Homoserinibacter sp. YIM 151385]
MSVLGMPESRIAELVRGVARSMPPEVLEDREALLERFARAAWSTIAEPGDGAAGALVGALGAFPALELLIETEGEPAMLAGGRLGGASSDPASTGPASSGLGSRALEEAVRRWWPRVAQRPVRLALEQARRFGIGLLVPGDPGWPQGLDDLGPHAPAALWFRGSPAGARPGEAAPASAPGIALVGARAATGYGEHVAVEAASGLVDRGVAIVSGAAYGIDGAAHRAALASGGRTIAVLAGGLDRFYPSGHEALLERISGEGGGLVLAEVPCGTAPTRWRFLQRNRIIAAISDATVVVEAGWRSGSLNTARHAAQLGRPIGAVPGPVTSTASSGCHRMLRELDAVCVTDAAEMAELLPTAGVDAAGPAPTRSADRGDEDAAEHPAERSRPSGARGRPAVVTAEDPEGTRARLLDAMSTRTARRPGDLASMSGLAPDRVRAMLGLLELDGIVRPRGDGWIRAGS